MEVAFVVPHELIEETIVYIDAVAERAEHLEPVLQRITDKILERNRRMYETHGASSGVYWSPLKATTILRKSGSTFKRKRGGSTVIPFPNRPLWRYGDLVDSLSVRHAKDQILQVDDSGIEIGTRHEAAGFHQTGTSRMPPRPPFVIPAKHAREYDGMIRDFIFGEGNA